MGYTKVTFVEAESLIQAALVANVNTLLIGPPGVGKTALASKLAKAIGLPLVTLIGSTIDQVEVGGFPVVRENGQFDRVPMAAIRRAADEPCILFLDEISTAPPPVQAAFLRLLHDRVAGDTVLHPDTRLLAACNPPEQAPGGFELSCPLIGRFQVFDFEPTLDEIRGWFKNCLGETEGKLGELALDWAATTEAEPRLIQIHPPQSAITSGDKWASPRDWERALRVDTALCETFKGDESTLIDLRFKGYAGAVGENAAQTFLSILKLRDKLPTVADIVKDPIAALVPETQYQIGALGLVANAASKDLHAAYAYAGRLDREIGEACVRALFGRKAPTRCPTKWVNEAKKVRVRFGASVCGAREVV